MSIIKKLIAKDEKKRRKAEKKAGVNLKNQA